MFGSMCCPLMVKLSGEGGEDSTFYFFTFLYIISFFSSPFLFLPSPCRWTLIHTCSHTRNFSDGDLSASLAPLFSLAKRCPAQDPHAHTLHPFNPVPCLSPGRCESFPPWSHTKAQKSLDDLGLICISPPNAIYTLSCPSFCGVLHGLSGQR